MARERKRGREEERKEKWMWKGKREKGAYAAVLAIWPKSPGPCEAGGAWAFAAGGACCAPCAGAYVVAGRFGWAWGGAARDGTVGRAGARPADRLRAILYVCVREREREKWIVLWRL